MRFTATIAIAVFAWVFTACGQKSSGPDVTYEPTPAPAPAPAPTPAPQPVPSDPKWDAAKAILAANCGKCHTGQGLPSFDTAAKFKASTAKARLDAGTMPPPPATISAADKAELLAYLAG